jgi:general secretion pathway protein M
MSDNRLTQARAAARARWAALAARERRLVLIAALVLGAGLLWAVGLAPALRTLAMAPAQLAAGEAQTQQMQALAHEAKALRAVAPVPMAQAQAALSAATGRLGEVAKLSLQGERAVVALKGISGDQLAAWLGEARAGARARVVEASLSQTAPGLYDGSLTLALGSAR